MNLVRALSICLPALLTGCTLITQELQALRDEQQRQHEVLELQHQRLEGQAQQLEELASVQTQMQTRMQSRPKDEAVTVNPVVAPSSPQQVIQTDGKLVLGRVEWAWLNNMDRPLKARIDTGAGTSSLNASQLQEFERDGKDWVRFVLFEDEEGAAKTFEAPLIRYLRIRQPSGHDRRPVIRLKLRLGQLTEETQFTLSDRSAMIYPILLGRDFLRDIAVVDVALKFVQPKPTPPVLPEGQR